uniref:Uncharacterized protein n=1 Tax=Lactuca sativa TaxID=4236 RepID=A0A9R1UGU4_LACSA|nr:hypothetical protein LSAT_V11C900478320 [Lactuca sativa]
MNIFIHKSATVDSQLFSHYFGDCPVIHAQGRTHPVPTYFLEDIHDSVDYKLASNSLASLRSNAPKQKVFYKLYISNVQYIIIIYYLANPKVSSSNNLETLLNGNAISVLV